MFISKILYLIKKIEKLINKVIGLTDLTRNNVQRNVKIIFNGE